MKRKWVAASIILFLVGTGIVSGLSPHTEEPLPASRGNWYYVGGSGPGNFTFIQDAINWSSDGDTVFVYNGTYFGYLYINKAISLIGEDKNTTILEGYGWGTYVNIHASPIRVTGFTIRNFGFDHCGGITIISGHATIAGNIVTQNIGFGIITYGSYNLIANNSIIDNPSGLGLEGGSHNNTVIGNRIESNNNNGIKIEFYYPSSNNTIRDNIIKNNGRGIDIFNGNNTHIMNNLIIYNGCGIYIFGEWWPEEPTYRNNTMIENNTIAFNDYGLIFGNANNSHVHHNNILNNREAQAYDDAYDFQAINFWDNGYPSGGNYWSDYNGSDDFSGPNQDIPGGDGIGDTPYNISGYGMNSKDRYPSMSPFGNQLPDKPCISGFAFGITGVRFGFSINVTDPDGDSVYCKWDWGDGNTTEWLGPYLSGTIVAISHSWSQKGSYEIRAMLMDDLGYQSRWSDPYVFDVYDVRIDGLAFGISNENHRFTITLTNTDGDSLYCKWDWGDGNTTEWLGPYLSGETFSVNHTWSHKGSYHIRICLKNNLGDTCCWSTVFRVYEMTQSFVFGTYSNLTEEGEHRVIEALNLRVISFKPFQFNHYTNRERFVVVETSSGAFRIFPLLRFIIGIGGIVIYG